MYVTNQGFSGRIPSGFFLGRLLTVKVNAPRYLPELQASRLPTRYRKGTSNAYLTWIADSKISLWLGLSGTKLRTLPLLDHETVFKSLIAGDVRVDFLTTVLHTDRSEKLKLNIFDLSELSGETLQVQNHYATALTMFPIVRLILSSSDFGIQ